jgi:predicted SAM-dependent methyltransferase
MKYLNLGCGGERQKSDEWVNLDDLHSQLPIGEGARDDLDKETNYVNFDVLSGPLPFDSDSFDGVLASHFFEHFDAQQGLAIMRECKRVLKTGGSLLVSVPSTEYFKQVHHVDRKENWPQLFDTHDPGNTYTSFFEAALWFEQHKVMLTAPALWAYFTRAGFRTEDNINGAPGEMVVRLNRRIFSLEMLATKP